MHAVHRFQNDDPVSPTTAAPQTIISSTSISPTLPQRDHRMTDFGNYRRDLSVLETSGNRIPHIHHNPPTATASSPNQIAPWMSANVPNATPSSAFTTSFYNDSSDNLSQGSQLSPGFRPGNAYTGNHAINDSPADNYFGDAEERRPSVVSTSSTGSKSSAGRGAGIHKKLHSFFGEDFSGKDGSDTSLPSHGKDTRSHSFARSHRDRKYSSATDQTPREASPAPSRPRTPVPSSDVVPFLYQDSQVCYFRCVAILSVRPSLLLPL